MTALAQGRLGRIVQADAYVKWYRSPACYSSPVKGSWAGEGGGALINQAIHQVDLLLYLVGDMDEALPLSNFASFLSLQAPRSQIPYSWNRGIDRICAVM
jgi:predicted dehydrogenase